MKIKATLDYENFDISWETAQALGFDIGDLAGEVVVNIRDHDDEIVEALSRMNIKVNITALGSAGLSLWLIADPENEDPRVTSTYFIPYASIISISTSTAQWQQRLDEQPRDADDFSLPEYLTRSAE